MKINNELINKVLGISADEPFEADKLALSIHKEIPDTVSFLDDEKFIEDISSNKNIKALFITPQLSRHFKEHTPVKIICDDPRYYFYSLYNHIAENDYTKFTSEIDETASIHKTAFVSETNVKIGKNVIIGPNASVLADVYIGDNSIIMPGAVLGSTGFEYKRTSRGIVSVFHDGKVVIHQNVEIGANTCIDKGFSFRDTVIGENSRIDNLVHIAHAAHIGKNCFIIAGAMVAGTVTIGDDVWIGPHANIAPQVNVGEKGFVTLGAVVTKDVPAGEMVSGVFAMPHKKFIEQLKRNSK